MIGRDSETTEINRLRRATLQAAVDVAWILRRAAVTAAPVRVGM